MPANASDIAAAIQPGSTEYGDRQTLEAGLAGAVGGGSPAASAAGGGIPGAAAIPENPLGALLSGEVSGDPNLPVTDGLSMGPGATPMSNDPMLGSRAGKLRQLAQEASSPQIRAAARNELRRMSREPI